MNHSSVFIKPKIDRCGPVLSTYYLSRIRDIYFKAQSRWGYISELHDAALAHSKAKGEIFKYRDYLNPGWAMTLDIYDVYRRWEDEKDKLPGFVDLQHIEFLWSKLKQEILRLYHTEGLSKYAGSMMDAELQ